MFRHSFAASILVFVSACGSSALVSGTPEPSPLPSPSPFPPTATTQFRLYSPDYGRAPLSAATLLESESLPKTLQIGTDQLVIDDVSIVNLHKGGFSVRIQASLVAPPKSGQITLTLPQDPRLPFFENATNGCELTPSALCDFYQCGDTCGGFDCRAPNQTSVPACHTIPLEIAEYSGRPSGPNPPSTIIERIAIETLDYDHQSNRWNSIKFGKFRYEAAAGAPDVPEESE